MNSKYWIKVVIAVAVLILFGLVIITKSFSAQAPTTLKGEVKTVERIPVVGALVWAWSDKGGSVTAKTGPDGTFILLLDTYARWHIGAAKDMEGFPYRSSEIIVDFANIPQNQVKLIITKIRKEPLIELVRVVGAAADQIIAEVPDGTLVKLPENSTVSVGEGPFAAYVDPESKISVEIKPTSEAPSELNARVVGLTYDIVFKNEDGKIIKELQQEFEVALHYRDEDLVNQGTDENNLRPAFFDEEKGSWVNIPVYTIDSNRNLVWVRLKHLTRFAIVSAADIVPPMPPEGIKGIALGQGRVKLSWQNPKRDFSYVKIYRSLKPGSLGSILSAEVSQEEFIDEETNPNALYYYTIHAVDPAGNESLNKNQVSVQVVGALPYKKTADKTKASYPKTEILPLSPTQAPIPLPTSAPPPMPPSPVYQGFFFRIWQAIFSLFQSL